MSLARLGVLVSKRRIALNQTAPCLTQACLPLMSACLESDWRGGLIWTIVRVVWAVPQIYNPTKQISCPNSLNCLLDYYLCSSVKCSRTCILLLILMRVEEGNDIQSVIISLSTNVILQGCMNIGTFWPLTWTRCQNDFLLKCTIDNW